MRLADASMRVTGTERPSSMKRRLMPALRPMIPMVMAASSAQLDLDVDAGREFELHQRVHGLVVRIDDVEDALVRAGLVLVAGVLVDVRRYQDGVAFDSRRQRDRAAHLGAGPLGCLDDLAGGTIDQAMIVSLQPNPDFLIRHGEYPFVKERREPDRSPGPHEIRAVFPRPGKRIPKNATVSLLAHRVRKYKGKHATLSNQARSFSCLSPPGGE